MSRREPKAEQWLRQQIDELGALRNASVRDPQFKAWRQNTLTFVQRIWPGESAKSERFRRIPFTPPSTRHDARVGREHFERGCGEAFEYLNTLLASLGDAGQPDASPAESENAAAPFAGDFPVIDLGADSGPPIFPPAPFTGGSAAPAANPMRDAARAELRSAGPPELPGTPALPAASERPIELFRGFPTLPENDAAPNPLPPAVPRPLPADSEGDPRANSLDEILPPPARHEIPSAPRASKAPRGRRGGKQRLKEMLGLSSLEVPAELSGPPAESEAPPPAAAPDPLPFAVPAPPRAAGPEAPRAAEIDDPPSESPSDHGLWTLPEFASTHESVAPLTAADIEAAHGAPRAEETGAGGSPARGTAAADALNPADAGDEEYEDARATTEFLLHSPVLSSVPRPAQRRAAESRSIAEEPLSLGDSAASELLAIAGEVDALGVPEGHRARVRVALTDLDRHLDEQSVSWEILRDAVNFIMEYPPLARRTLPLLLPHLDRAA